MIIDVYGKSEYNLEKLNKMCYNADSNDYTDF